MSKSGAIDSKHYLITGLVLLMLLYTKTVARQNMPDAGLIRFGVDTTYYERAIGGMDFVLERPCSSVNEAGCYTHFVGGFGSGCYITSVIGANSRFRRYGEIDLDELDACPPDTAMIEDAGSGLGVFMCPPRISIQLHRHRVCNENRGRYPS
jgi:hypothetical protein